MTRIELPNIVPAGGGRVDRILVPAFEGEGPTGRLDGPVSAVAARLAGRTGWRGAVGQVAEAESAQGAVELRGLGAPAVLDARALAGWLESVLEAARVAGARSVRLLLPDHPVARGRVATERIGRQAALATHRFERFRSEPRIGRLERIEIAPAPGPAPGHAASLACAAAIAAGVALARELGNAPPNEATPEWMAVAARDLARRTGASVQVLGPTQLRRRGMGGLLSVGGGSTHPPRLVRLELGEGSQTVALVGKGVTFDTGGISIKPAAQMDEMKWDKCGACAALGVVEAFARLEPPVRLRVYLPFAENMPDGGAYRPGDIVRCANGRTVEIVNTDAEGRMILADALSWAAAERPDHLLEMSTLTGACEVALGRTGAGLFTPDDDLAGELLTAAEEAGERLWRLPLWPEFLEEMRGTHSDLKNSGGRWGGASTAAAFLSQFVAPVTRWAHLDIAGPAALGAEAKGARGATGYGVALVLRWLGGLRRRRRG